MTRVLVTGDSHVATIWRHLSATGQPHDPYIRGDLSISVLPFGPAGSMKGPFFDAFPEHVEFNRDELRQRLTRLPPAEPHFDVIGLSGPLLTLWVWSKDWRNFSIDEDRQGHFVSSAVYERIFLDKSRHMIELVEIVRRTREVFVLEPPGPFRHHHCVKRNGPATTISVFRRYNSYLKGVFRDLGVPVVGLREEWFDEDGFMKAEYRRDDLDMHHGSAELGRLMLEEICSFVSGRAASSLPGRVMKLTPAPGAMGREASTT